MDHDRIEDDVIVVTRTVRIPRREVDVRFSPSGGPGGQHANRASTRVELTFDVEASEALTEPQRALLLERLGPVVRVVADDERSQHRNRTLAEQRLAGRLAGALHVARPRRPTRPSRGATERRLAAKKRRSATKDARRRPGSRDD